MAEKTSIGYLPGTDPETVRANMDYQQALQRMQAALNARQNRLFDPEMLAFAQGMLTPGQTGSFGEGLGVAAKNLREAQAQQEREEREIASAQLGLAGRGLELERLKQRERQFGNLLGDEPPTSEGQPAGALPSEPRTGGALSTGAPPRGFEGVQGIPTMPPNPNMMTGRQYLGMARLDPSISPTTAMKDAQKLDQDRFQARESGVQDLSSGMFYQFPRGEQVARQIFGHEGEFRVDAKTAALLDLYASNGDPRYYDIARKVVEGPKVPARAAGEGAPEAPGRIKSVSETEAEAAGAKESAQQRAKAQEEDRKKVLSNASDASSRIGMYKQLEKIAGGSQSKLLFGIFERSGLWPQIGKLVESGIGTPGFTIGIPAIREVMTNAKLPQNLIDQYQYAASLMANIQLQISRLGEGQGAVSDFERSLFGQAGVTVKDNPGTILAKLDLLRARAELDREVANEVRKYKGNIDDFKASEQYSRMVQSYEDKLSNIIQNRLSGSVRPAERTPGASGGRDNRSAASRLPADVR